MPREEGRRMTAAELMEAAAPLWARGYTARQIAEMLGANRERLKSLAKRHRDRFPRRYGRGNA